MKKYVLQTLVPFCYYIGIGFFNTAMAFDAPPYAITHQLTHTFELKPISSDSYQISKATFLPDYVENGFSGNKLDDDYNGMEGDCKNIDNLYTTKNCTYPKAVVAASLCPFLPGHYTRCECLPQFKITSCNTPYILGGDNCDGKYEKCVCPATVSLTCPNDKCISTCDGKCINKTCSPWSSQINCTNGTKSCDDGCCGTNRKCCIPCTDKITTKPSNSSYTTSKCTDGNGTHDINSGWVCNSGYHEKNGECEKDCNATNCSGFPLSNKPDNANFSTCTITATNCSTDGERYKIDSCLDGYTLDGGSCRAQTCADKGMKDCNGSCIATSECCGGCGSGEKCSNGTCVAKTCAEKGMKDCNGSCIATSECCGDCPNGQTCKNGSCVAAEKKCSDSGYYGGTACSKWSGYTMSKCSTEYGSMGSSCNQSGQVGSGTCDVDSWRRCCEQCIGGI